MLQSMIQNGVWTLSLDGQVLLEHRPDRPFAVTLRREKTYSANRGTVKEQVAELDRCPLTEAAPEGDAVVLTGGDHCLRVTPRELEHGAVLELCGEAGRAYTFTLPAEADEAENSLTFWHCGAAACSLARRDTGAAVGVHPNRRIGPAMDFGCEAFPTATVFRVGREPDGSFRFFLAEGELLDKPKQFTGTSVVVRTDAPVRELVENSVKAGFEPHFAVLRGRHRKTLEYLAQFFGFEVVKYE